MILTALGVSPVRGCLQAAVKMLTALIPYFVQLQLGKLAGFHLFLSLSMTSFIREIENPSSI